MIYQQDHPDLVKRLRLLLLVIPGLMLNFYPWGLSVNLVIPEALIVLELCIMDLSAMPPCWPRCRWRFDKVEAEDQFVVEGCRKGLIASL